MADILQTSHSNLMDQRAKGKRLHRRTQSSTKHDFNSLINKKAATEEFVQEMLQSQNILNIDATQRALEADAQKYTDNEIEVIVDDIDEVPNTGFVVPKAHYSSNPLNLISKRNLTARVGSLGNLYPTKKVHLLDQIKDNIDEFTGLNTIHEKKSSIDSLDIEGLGNKSSDLLSVCHSQGSKNPSRTHSKQSSLDIRPGHSKTSSADFRNINFNQPSFDLRPTNQNFKAEKENIHFTKKLSSFSTHDPNEILTGAGSSLGYGVGLCKRGHNTRSQNASAHNFTSKFDLNNTSPKPQGASISIVGSTSPKNSNIHTLKTPQEKTLRNAKSNIKVMKESKAINNKAEVDYTSYTSGMDSKISDLSTSMKNLSQKTEMLENQIKSIFNVVDAFAQDKTYLEEKVKAQDEKIKLLMNLANKYEEEINNLKGLHSQKSEKYIKIGSKKIREIPTSTILTTTDISSIESPISDNSGFYTGKESKESSVKNFPPSINLQIQKYAGRNEKFGNDAYKGKSDHLRSYQLIEDPKTKKKGKL